MCGAPKEKVLRLLARVGEWIRGVSRAYCEGAVRRSLAVEPLDGRDWFLDAVGRSGR